MNYSPEDLQDALDLAKPGRVLELDKDGNMSKGCVAAVIHNLCALAEAYQLAKSQEARWFKEFTDETSKHSNAIKRAEEAEARSNAMRKNLTDLYAGCGRHGSRVAEFGQKPVCVQCMEEQIKWLRLALEDVRDLGNCCVGAKGDWAGRGHRPGVEHHPNCRVTKALTPPAQEE